MEKASNGPFREIIYDQEEFLTTRSRMDSFEKPMIIAGGECYSEAWEALTLHMNGRHYTKPLKGSLPIIRSN